LAEVSRLREEALFADARIRKSLTAYYRYLTEYPQGLHVMEAREFINDRKGLESLKLEVPDIEKAWDLTLELDSYFQYDWFIKQFPESRYSQKAKELLRKRKEAIGSLKN
jgi:outer membrane protein assembly factor BamD (BamD/ComL family)